MVVGEMGQTIGETGVGEMGVGETGTNRTIYYLCMGLVGRSSSLDSFLYSYDPHFLVSGLSKAFA